MYLNAFITFVVVVSLNFDSVHSSCITNDGTDGSNDVSIESVSDAIAQYTIKQYQDMAKDSKTKFENIITSPYSIWSALALTYLGTRGNTSIVLGNVLGLNGMNKSLVEENMKVLNNIISSNGSNVLKVASKIAVEKTLNLRSCVANDPLASISAANFKSNAEGERVKLNKWVTTKTNGLIRNLLPEGSITPRTLLTVLNAVYFKGKWKQEFDKRKTQKETFSSLNGDNKVPMMKMLGYMDYGFDQSIGAYYVDLPYDGGKYSMLAILPHQTDSDIDKVIGKLSINVLHSMQRNMYNRRVALSFPRFELTKTYNLKNVLSDLGASPLFSSIDLSGILGSTMHMHMENIFHKAYIKVEEKGTEAAGATGIVNTKIMVVMEPQRLSFDRPFAFVLRERSSNAVLFMGVIKNL